MGSECRCPLVHAGGHAPQRGLPLLLLGRGQDVQRVVVVLPPANDVHLVDQSALQIRMEPDLLPDEEPGLETVPGGGVAEPTIEG